MRGTFTKVSAHFIPDIAANVPQIGDYVHVYDKVRFLNQAWKFAGVNSDKSWLLVRDLKEAK